MTDENRPVEIDGSLNYNEESDTYWHGVLGWVPDYVDAMKAGALGVKDGVLYRYIGHTGELGEEVHVFFKKVDE